MDLERLSVVLRPRGWAEAIDLGFRMARRWWRPIVGPWLIVTVPLPALGFVLLYDYPALVFLLVWWLKPLYERVPLFVLSRALFGSLPDIRETLRALPGLWRRRALHALTVARFDPLRSFHMPIHDLEGLSGRTRSARRALLARPVVQQGVMLAAFCAACEIFLALTLPLLLLMLLPETRSSEALFAALFEDQDPVWILRFTWLTLASWLVAMAVIGPLYVAGGFGLYVTRRTRLEAWDIEFAFRRLAHRLERLRGGRTAAAWLLAATLVLGLGSATVEAAAVPTGAANEIQSAADESVRDSIERILADPVFGTERTESYRRLKGSIGAESAGFLGFVDVGAWLAVIFSRLLWVALVVLVVYFVVRLAMNSGAPRAPRAAADEPAPPGVVLGLDLRAASLPEDVPAEALRRWEAGERAAAIRLLYRATLARLIADGLPVRDSATEGDCLSLARRLRGDVAAYFARLTGEWQRTAYGHGDPSEDAGPELIREWSERFGVVP